MSNPKKRSEAANASRFQELDVLRGLAAVAVLLFHYLTRYDQKYIPRGDVPFGFADGAYGVHLFFVISGFVIFMTLSRCKTASEFLVSRLSRLYPAYWAAALLTCAVGTWWPLPGQHYTVMQLLTNLTMLQGFGRVAPIDGVYWTLNVELCFYAVMLALFASGLLASTVRLSVVWLAAAAGTHLLSYLGFAVPETIRQVFVLKYAALFVAGINFFEIYEKGPTRHPGGLDPCLLVGALDRLWRSERGAGNGYFWISRGCGLRPGPVSLCAPARLARHDFLFALSDASDDRICRDQVSERGPDPVDRRRSGDDDPGADHGKRDDLFCRAPGVAGHPLETQGKQVTVGSSLRGSSFEGR